MNALRRPAMARLLGGRRPRTVDDSRMSLTDHLVELRRRVLVSLVLVVIATLVVGIWAYHPLLDAMRAPYCDLPARYHFAVGADRCALVFSHPSDAFLLRLKVALLGGVILSAPGWLYQLWAFITPGLHRHERRWALSFVFISVLLFSGGLVAASLVLGPALRVLLGFGGDGVLGLLEANEYLSFITHLLLIFGISFEFPVVLVLLNLAGVLPARNLRRWWRAIVFGIFAFAGVATPTQDPFTMLALAIPLAALFGIALGFCTWHDRRRRRRDPSRYYDELADDETSPLDLPDTVLPGTQATAPTPDGLAGSAAPQPSVLHEMYDSSDVS